MLERTAVPETSRPAPGLRLPGQVGMSSQLLQFAIVVLGIALVTFIMYLYVLPNSQINAAHTKIAELQAQKAELYRQEFRSVEGDCTRLRPEEPGNPSSADRHGAGRKCDLSQHAGLGRSSGWQSEPAGRPYRRSRCRSQYPGQSIVGRQRRAASQATSQRCGRLGRRHA